MFGSIKLPKEHGLNPMVGGIVFVETVVLEKLESMTERGGE